MDCKKPYVWKINQYNNTLCIVKHVLFFLVFWLFCCWVFFLDLMCFGKTENSTSEKPEMRYVCEISVSNKFILNKNID